MIKGVPFFTLFVYLSLVRGLKQAAFNCLVGLSPLPWMGRKQHPIAP